ncbi:hypothetical protein Cgig2_008971 [Carnegiea gigantea]|uniref:DNA replication ATP-dependent helicase/nuclease n=1 Tax=Carnegiea gigantea TaxID=171969 RepID=A0A9Q1K7U0_9CARY|nr:hypothetical protein Cgig2_008971 [Carnegiea gigantea]
MFASKFVLVGDHYQLPPLVKSVEARESGMSVSLFRRLSEAHPQAISALRSQYRMCAGIMKLSNALIYGDRLRCGSPGVENAKLKLLNGKPTSSWLKEVKKNVYYPGLPLPVLCVLGHPCGLCLSASHKVEIHDSDILPAFETKDHKTVSNPIEACIVAEITEALANYGVAKEEIGIITPYNSQANLIQHVLSMASVEVHTIDKYQVIYVCFSIFKVGRSF